MSKDQQDAAMDAANRKGYMPDAMATEWAQFDYQEVSSDALSRRSASGAQQQDDHAGSPAPSPSLTLSADDTAFLAARLRRLFSHFGYSLPAFAVKDASLIRIAGSCIGAILSQIGDADAVTDAEGYDGCVTMGRIERLRAILARAGITRKPLPADELDRVIAQANDGFIGGPWLVEVCRAVERAHGITPQAGKESGDA